MAHYALIENGVVVQVITGRDENELIDGMDPEDYYSQVTGFLCKRTSYNTVGNQRNNYAEGEPFRGNYAGPGYLYDEVNDVFIEPSPYPSWVLDETVWRYVPPVPRPDTESRVRWNEDIVDWEIVPN